MRAKIVCGAFVLALLFSNSLFGHTDAQRKAQVIQELSTHFDAEWITSIFNHQNACEGLDVPQERLRSWGELETRVLAEESITRGVAFYNENVLTLTSTASAYRDTTNTLPFVTVAILRIESNLGENRAGTPVVQTLYRKYSKVPDGPSGDSARARILTRELVPFLTMARENEWSVCDIRGTHAAAFGFPHFIPESLRLSVDGDNDGKVDLAWNLPDAVASIGNYLEKTGWHRSPKKAVFRYNPDNRYVQIVMRYAQEVEKRVRQ